MRMDFKTLSVNCFWVYITTLSNRCFPSTKHEPHPPLTSNNKTKQKKNCPGRNDFVPISHGQLSIKSVSG